MKSVWIGRVLCLRDVPRSVFVASREPVANVRRQAGSIFFQQCFKFRFFWKSANDGVTIVAKWCGKNFSFPTHLFQSAELIQSSKIFKMELLLIFKLKIIVISEFSPLFPFKNIFFFNFIFCFSPRFLEKLWRKCFWEKPS